MEYKDSSILSLVPNIDTIYMNIEVNDDFTWVVGFRLKTTRSRWSMGVCRCNQDERLPRFFCFDSKAIFG